MPAAALKLEGLPETVKILGTLPAKIQKRATKKATRAGGAPFVKAAKRNAPTRRGIFKRSLASKMKTYGGGVVHVHVTGQLKSYQIKSTAKVRNFRGGISGRGDAVPIHFVEKDIRPHHIAAKGKAMSFSVADVDYGLDEVYTKTVRHPGARGQHFMRRSARASEGECRRRFTHKLATEVYREARQV